MSAKPVARGFGFGSNTGFAAARERVFTYQSEWRPPLAREALRWSPLLEAGGADPARIERVPLIAAPAEPFVVFAGRPAAERAADAWGAGFLPILIPSLW
jgi:hypothetical protein